MILLGDFFTIGSLETPVHDGSFTVKAILDINPSHPIFEGHFPGQPVVPGVCMMQMIKEVLETVIGQETRLVSAASAKFLAMIDPGETRQVSAELICRGEDAGGPGKQISVEGKFFKEEVTYLKYKAVFKTL